MDYSVIIKNSDCIFHSLIEYFENKPDLFQPIAKLSGIALSINNKHLIVINNKSQHIIKLEGSLIEQYSFFINSCLIKSKIDPDTAYHIISDFMKYSNEEKLLFKLFSFLSWPGASKGLDFIETYSFFSPFLKELLSNKKVGLNEAYLFHKTFINQYDKLLEIISNKASFSECSFMLRVISELHSKTLTQDWFISYLDKSNSAESVILLNKIKYKNVNLARELFDNYINLYKLPSYSKIAYDLNFERNNHDLNLSFSSRSDLIKKLKSLTEILVTNENIFISNNIEDLFDINKLYEKTEMNI